MGLGDFISGIGEGVGEIASSAGGAIKNTAKVAGWVANPTHWDDIGRGAVKGAEFVGHHIEDTAKGVEFLASHPQYWGETAKKMIVDQFTNPVNIAANVAMLGLTVATGGAAGAGFIGEAAEVAEGVSTGVKAARAAEETASTVKTAEGAAEVAKSVSVYDQGAEAAASTASRGNSFQRGAQAVQSKLDAASQLPTKIHQSIRESLGLNPLSMTQRARQGLAEGFLERTGGLEVRQTEGAVQQGLEHARQFVGQRIANAPGAPSLVGGGEASDVAKLNYRANKISSQISAVKDFRSNLHTKALEVQAVADPEKAAIGLAKAHKGDILKFGARHAGDAAVSSIKDSLFGNKKSPSTMPQVEAPAAPATTNWERSDTGMVASQPRSVSSGGAVTTTSATSAGAVGPSKWYGQSGYSTGRGFQSPASQQQWGTTPWTQDPAYS